LQLISNLIISKPISLVKAALVCLQIPIVWKSRIDTFSKPPCLHTNWLLN
jgi:hypothetical protein